MLTSVTEKGFNYIKDKLEGQEAVWVKSLGLSKSQASAVHNLGLSFPFLGGIPRDWGVHAARCAWHLCELGQAGWKAVQPVGDLPFPSLSAKLSPKPSTHSVNMQRLVHVFLCEQSITSSPHPVIISHPSKPSPSPISRHPLTLSLPTRHQTFRPRAPRTVEATPVSSPMNHLLLAEAVILQKILNGDLFSPPRTFFPRWAWGWLPSLFYLLYLIISRYIF